MVNFLKSILLKDSETQSVTYLKNHDLIPMQDERRLWGYGGYLFYWLINKALVGTWTNASSLFSLGFSVGQIMGILAISFVFIVTLSLLNGQIGSDYFIGFTVSMRITFGIRGSYFAVCMRTILSIVWYASQCWMGGLCVNVCLSCWSKPYMNMENTFPDSVNFTSQELCGFIVFQLIQLPLMFVKPEKLKPFIIGSSLYSFCAMLGILIAAVKTKVGPGLGELMHHNGSLSGSQFSWTFLYGICTTYGGICSGVTNMSDYTRFSKTRYAPYPGTVLSWYTAGIVVPMMGLIVASTMQQKYGRIIWRPNEFMLVWLDETYSPAVRAGCFFGAFAFVCSSCVFNVMGNAVAGGMDMSGICPKYINIRRGALITALLSWVIQPWDFYNTSSTFQTVMSSFSVFMTPLIASLCCDYLLIRRRRLKLSDLYSDNPEGIYWYWHGFNFRGFLAFACSSGPSLAGLVNRANPSLHITDGATKFYDGNLFFSFPIAFFVYYMSNRFFPMEGTTETDSVDYFNIYTPEQLLAKNMMSFDEWFATKDNGLEFIGSEDTSENESKEAVAVTEKETKSM